MTEKNGLLKSLLILFIAGIIILLLLIAYPFWFLFVKIINRISENFCRASSFFKRTWFKRYIAHLQQLRHLVEHARNLLIGFLHDLILTQGIGLASLLCKKTGVDKYFKRSIMVKSR